MSTPNAMAAITAAPNIADNMIFSRRSMSINLSRRKACRQSDASLDVPVHGIEAPLLPVKIRADDEVAI